MFELKILDQYWASKEAQKNDLCSYGHIFLKINDTIISDEKDEDWTISTTALQLLRSINADHYVNKDSPIILGCGQLDSIGCPISIDWQSMLHNDIIKISDIRKCSTTSEIGLITYNGLNTVIDIKSYTKEVGSFAGMVIQFFNGHNPRFADEDDKNKYKTFWSELYRLYHSLEK